MTRLTGRLRSAPSRPADPSAFATGPGRSVRSPGPLLAAVALLGVVAAAAAQSLRIEPRFTPGRILYVEDRTACWFSLVPEGLDDPDAALVVADVTLGVLERAETVVGGGLRLEHTIDRVAIAFRGPPALALHYDTDTPDDPAGPVAELRKLLGRRYVVTLDIEGRVIHIRSAVPLRRQIESAARGLPALRPVVAVLRDTQIRKRCSPGGIDLTTPPHRLRVGDTWSREAIEPLAGGGTVHACYSYRLAEAESVRGRRIARIELHGTLAPAGPPLPMALFADQTARLDAGSVEGWAVFDVARGRFTRVRTRSRLTLAAVDAAGSDTGLRLYAATRFTRVVLTRGKRAQVLRQHRRR